MECLYGIEGIYRIPALISHTVSPLSYQFYPDFRHVHSEQQYNTSSFLDRHHVTNKLYS